VAGVTSTPTQAEMPRADKRMTDFAFISPHGILFPPGSLKTRREDMPPRPSCHTAQDGPCQRLNTLGQANWGVNHGPRALDPTGFLKAISSRWQHLLGFLSQLEGSL
jgi:hypothetical protein